MATQTKKSTRSKPKPASKDALPDELKKRWGTKTSGLPEYVRDSLYQAAHFLDKEARQRVGLMMSIPVFVQDPLVALENPLLGVKEIDVRLEAGMGDGPTSSRLAVVDYNADTQTLLDPVVWVKENGWFRTPAGEWLPNAPSKMPSEPAEPAKVEDPTKLEEYEAELEKYKAKYEKYKVRLEKYKEECRKFTKAVVKNPYFHQLNLWAVVQRVLEFYEDPHALGRPVPWGFNGNRLILVPHAGYGENAFYDQTTKSLQFYYFGDPQNPGYTCLSHDIIAHETGHAILDGIRPLYNENPSVQTAAFHEFIGDLTAILLALFNKNIRSFLAETTQGNLHAAEVLANVAEQFGQEVDERPYLRTAFNKLCMQSPEIQNSLSAHNVSQVMTGAMFDILIGIAQKHMAKNRPVEESDPDTDSDTEDAASQPKRTVTPAQTLWWAADYFRQAALQPLDLCPPCDIQFIDYAKAVIRNSLLSDPIDTNDYRSLMLAVFHKRRLCTCAFDPDQNLPQDCRFQEALSLPKPDFVYHDIERVARSRTAAYYFLNDNRIPLHIPPQQDIVVADLYDNSKYGALAERLPHQVVLEYTWQEEVEFKDDPVNGLEFGALAGKKINLTCGGTLVFDDRGNLLSWSRKPGTQHLSPTQVKDIRRRNEAWQKDPDNAKIQKIKKPTKLESAALADQEAGEERRKTLLAQFASKQQRGLIGLQDGTAANLPREAMKPVTAIEEDGVIRFSNTPHLRKENLDREATGWLINY